jgi:hypothetical protein
VNSADWQDIIDGMPCVDGDGCYLCSNSPFARPKPQGIVGGMMSNAIGMLIEYYGKPPVEPAPHGPTRCHQ